MDGPRALVCRGAAVSPCVPAIAEICTRLDGLPLAIGAATALGPIADPVLVATLERQFFDLARARVGDTRWSDAVQAGRRLAFRDAIELALAAPETCQITPPLPQTMRA